MTADAGQAIRLHMLPEAPGGDGEPRAALVLPAEGGERTRRAVTLLFPTIAAALVEKRRLEGATA